MIPAIRKKLIDIRVGFLHAKYHRFMRKAIQAQEDKNLIKFKKYVYRAEDAWRKIVILIETKKQWEESQHTPD